MFWRNICLLITLIFGALYFNEKWGNKACLIFIIAALAIYGIALLIRRWLKDRNERRIERELREDEEQQFAYYSLFMSGLEKKYGLPDTLCELEPGNRNRTIAVYRQANIIYILGEEMPLDLLKDCRVREKTTFRHIKETTTESVPTDSKDMLRRMLWGGFLFGQSGAILGGLTTPDEKEVEVEQYSKVRNTVYELIVTFDCTTKPEHTYSFRANHEDAYKAEEIIREIITQNNKP